MNIQRIIIFLSLSLGVLYPARAQVTLQVASRTIERAVPAQGIRTLHLNAEKADIEVVAWDKAEINVTLELSARHPDRSVATTDLAKMQYLAERQGRDYFLRNYIVLKSGEAKPVSNLKAHYRIQVPAGCALEVRNSFGTVLLKGLQNSIKMKADFCTTSLTDLSGRMLLETTFGDLKARYLQGTLAFTTDHTDLQLDDVGGTVKLDAHYGSVAIQPSPALNSLTIQSRKSVVTLLAKDWQRYDYDIQTAYAATQLPNGFRWKRNTPDFKEAFFKRNQTAFVHINAEFGTLTVR
ncbi:hypothetical protein GCM10027275_00750 [Rhabdobacter roseus]|uniref:Adhesin domain-containing protein n=1 Tax=Rhabdobacter roseus TaxID=1655419 RepID=A0A840TQD4_9BACT|nr:DUF4097 family beta strand repeat-containing protein [Rhabdobacter roseus]MBB5281959.1 hypothetical protein [Rhabdobacter roseus]